MRRILLTAMVLLLAGSAVYAMAQLPSGDEVNPEPQTAPSVCPAVGWTVPQEGVTDFSIIQSFDPICRADCREDYGACLISTPKYICQALYQNCLAACDL